MRGVPGLFAFLKDLAGIAARDGQKSSLPI